MIRINSHPSMSTALMPGHKATNQIDKYAWCGCFWLNCYNFIFTPCAIIWFYVNIMGHDQTATLGNLGTD